MNDDVKKLLSLLACCTVFAVAYNLNGMWGLLEVAISGAMAIVLLAVYQTLFSGVNINI